MEEKQINAIYESELEKFLANIQILDKVKKGEYCCIACGEKINIGNFGGIIQVAGNLELFCNKEKCIKEASKKINE